MKRSTVPLFYFLSVIHIYIFKLISMNDMFRLNSMLCYIFVNSYQLPLKHILFIIIALALS
jgi:hypothetical protein